MITPDSAELPVIIDIEASGFGKGSYPIEIGYYSENSETTSARIRITTKSIFL